MQIAELPGTLFHVGYVVPDLDAALSNFNGRLGAPRFKVLRDAEIENGFFRGEPASIVISMAFGYVGGVQFEFIQPAAGRNSANEFLARQPGGGVHHLCYAVDDFRAAESSLLSRGFRAVQGGTYGETRFGYFESDDDPGTLTELLFVAPDLAEMFEEVRSQRF